MSVSISLLHREELQQLLELGEKATKGPWTVRTNTIDSKHGYVGTMFLDGNWVNNAPFVAAAKNALPAIKAALEGQDQGANDAELLELRAYVQSVEKWMRAFGEGYKELANQAPTFIQRSR